MGEENYKHSELTDKIIEAFYKVYNALGYGFLEKVYENSMVVELRRMGLNVTVQQPVKVYLRRGGSRLLFCRPCS